MSLKITPWLFLARSESPKVSSKETSTHLEDGGGGLSTPEDSSSRPVSTTYTESCTFSVTREEVQ